MSGVSSLDLPAELKERIEQGARDRQENPSSLIASALDLLLEADNLQLEDTQPCQFRSHIVVATPPDAHLIRRLHVASR